MIAAMSNILLVEKADGVATVTLNRPDRMNSLTSAMLSQLAVALRELADDSAVRVVVLTGAGERAFSAGADLAPPDGRSPAQRAAPGGPTLEETFDNLKRLQESSWLLHTMSKPTHRRDQRRGGGRVALDGAGLRHPGGERQRDPGDRVRAHRLLGRLRRLVLPDQAGRLGEGARDVPPERPDRRRGGAAHRAALPRVRRRRLPQGGRRARAPARRGPAALVPLHEAAPEPGRARPPARRARPGSGSDDVHRPQRGLPRGHGRVPGQVKAKVHAAGAERAQASAVRQDSHNPA